MTRHLPGHGPYTDAIQGQVYHSLSSLDPPKDQSRAYGQLYFYAPDEALDRRLSLFDGLDRDLLAQLQTVLYYDVRTSSAQHLASLPSTIQNNAPSRMQFWKLLFRRFADHPFCYYVDGREILIASYICNSAYETVALRGEGPRQYSERMQRLYKKKASRGEDPRQYREQRQSRFRGYVINGEGGQTTIQRAWAEAIQQMVGALRGDCDNTESGGRGYTKKGRFAGRPRHNTESVGALVSHYYSF